MSSPASALAKLRRKVRHKCPVCEKSFVGIKKAVYCSNACRQKAKYRRTRAASAAAKKPTKQPRCQQRSRCLRIKRGAGLSKFLAAPVFRCFGCVLTGGDGE